MNEDINDLFKNFDDMNFDKAKEYLEGLSEEELERVFIDYNRSYFLGYLKYWMTAKRYSPEIAATILKCKEEHVVGMISGKLLPNKRALGLFLRAIIWDVTRDMIGE